MPTKRAIKAIVTSVSESIMANEDLHKFAHDYAAEQLKKAGIEFDYTSDERNEDIEHLFYGIVNETMANIVAQAVATWNTELRWGSKESQQVQATAD